MSDSIIFKDMCDISSGEFWAHDLVSGQPVNEYTKDLIIGTRSWGVG